MTVLLWIIGFLVKVILPVIIIVIITGEIMNRKYHFLIVKNGIDKDYTYAYEKAAVIVFGSVFVITAIVDIIYLLNIKTPEAISGIVNYLVEHHSTLYTYFRYGLTEKPIRTYIYLAYLLFVAIKAGKIFIIDSVKDAEEAARNI